MSFEVTIRMQFDSYQEMATRLAGMGAGAYGAMFPPACAPAEAEPATVQIEPPETTPEPQAPKATRRSKKPQAAPEAAAQPELVEPASQEVLDESTVVEKPDLDKVRVALSAVMEKRGREVAKDILAAFDAARISEVKEPDYGTFIARCDKEVEAAAA